MDVPVIARVSCVATSASRVSALSTASSAADAPPDPPLSSAFGSVAMPSLLRANARRLTAADPSRIPQLNETASRSRRAGTRLT